MKHRLNVTPFAFCRLIIFTPIRMIYPFLPALARGLKVNLETISLAVSASMITSAIAPFLAPVAERRGRKLGMLLGLLLFSLGVLLALGRVRVKKIPLSRPDRSYSF